MVTILPQEHGWADAFANIGKGVSQGYMDRSDENTLKKAIMDLGPNPTPRQIVDAVTGARTFNPESKQRAVKNYMGVAEYEKSQNLADNAARKQNYIDAGYPDYQANILADPKTTPGEKQQIASEHRELVARGIRNPVVPQEEQAGQQEEPLPAEAPQSGPMAEVARGEETPLEIEEAAAPIADSVQKAAEKPIETAQKKQEAKPKEEWPEIAPPPETTFAEKEKWRSGNQKENNKLLKETTDKGKAHTNALIRYNRLATINDTGKLPERLGNIIIDPKTGEPYPEASLLGLVNKETQDFVKTMNDFLIDAKTYFGSRVTNFDVGAFKSRLPSLLNTPDGRRLIIEQMKIMEELQKVHDDELSGALKHYGRNASYSDIQGVVDEKTSAREAQLIEKMNSLDDASNKLDTMAKNPAKFKDTKLFQDTETGKFKAVRKSDLKKVPKGWVEW